MWSHIPFALFLTAELDEETLNRIIKQGRDGAQGVWAFWLARPNYSDAPRKDPKWANQGDEPPVSNKTSFLGKTVDDLAIWMREIPPGVDLDEHHFAVLDEQFRKDGSILLCRVGGEGLKDKGVLDTMRMPNMYDAALFMHGMDAFEWEERTGRR